MTTYSSTDSVLKTLIGFVIQRGVVVTLIQTVFLAMFYALPSHLYWYVELRHVCSPRSRRDSDADWTGWGSTSM